MVNKHFKISVVKKIIQYDYLTLKIFHITALMSIIKYCMMQ